MPQQTTSPDLTRSNKELVDHPKRRTPQPHEQASNANGLQSNPSAVNTSQDQRASSTIEEGIMGL